MVLRLSALSLDNSRHELVRPTFRNPVESLALVAKLETLGKPCPQPPLSGHLLDQEIGLVTLNERQVKVFENLCHRVPPLGLGGSYACQCLTSITVCEGDTCHNIYQNVVNLE